MTVLVIGSKGFIGGHVFAYFSKVHEVWGCDVVVDYTDAFYIQIDATNADYTSIFKQKSFDVCINCSGAANVPYSITNPQRDFQLNTLNVYKQLDAIRTYNSKCKYINLSSAAVYGNPEYLPIDEEHLLNPISPYGVHKKMAEEICDLFYSTYGIQTCSLRIFSAYGEGLQKQLFFDMFQKSNSRQAIALYGTGKETRDFIYINDILQAIHVIINNSEFKNDIINVASGKETTIKEAAEIFFSIYKPKIKIDFQRKARKGDPLHWKANIQKLCGMDFEPKMSLREGLTNYVAWLKEKNWD